MAPSRLVRLCLLLQPRPDESSFASTLIWGGDEEFIPRCAHLNPSKRPYAWTLAKFAQAQYHC